MSYGFVEGLVGHWQQIYCM